MNSSSSYCLSLMDHLRSGISGKYLFGHEPLLRSFLIAFLAGGHILIEGPPGTGKTMTAKLMARVLSKSFRRVQFTSDMLPGDLIGAHLYNPAQGSFEFIPGPLFTDFVIADEINRTSPRTQSALLEAMEERQITVEGKSLKLSADFFVVATQNPLDFEGTYPLPESQLDRFLFKLVLQHAAPSVEVDIMEGIVKGVLPPNFEQVSPLAIDPAQIQKEIEGVTIDRSILGYISQILEQTRKSPSLSWGSSIRGGIALIKCARILALLNGRNFVIPDDIKELALPVLRHRIRLTPDAQVSNVSEASVLTDLIARVPFPT